MVFRGWFNMHCRHLIFPFLVMAVSSMASERQITNDPNTNCVLDYNHNFSPDGQWLVFDTRPFDRDILYSTSIEKVHVVTGERVVLYRAPDPVPDLGPGVAAVSYFPLRDEVIFIHGPFTRTRLKYEKTRRTGAIVPGDGSGGVTWADARDVTPPFTPGALRGGTHRHDPGGPDGRWIGFTYDDQVMAEYGRKVGRDLHLRTLGVTHLGAPVAVDEDSAGENRSGAGFSVVVVRVTPKDELDGNPGTDAIYRAQDDQWVGRRGYRKLDGTWQLARGFIGVMRVPDGRGEMRDHDEVFVVDIPDDITRPGPDGPLEGTEATFPSPPAGTTQRRLTHTERGCYGLVRSASDGSALSFLSRDENGKPQVFTISPLGSEMRQVTSFPTGVQEAARWLPDDRHFVTVVDDQVVVVEIGTGHSRPLTDSGRGRPFGLVLSPDGRLVAFNRTVESGGAKTNEIFVADIVLP